jgi:hypothetical protein
VTVLHSRSLAGSVALVLLVVSSGCERTGIIANGPNKSSGKKGITPEFEVRNFKVAQDKPTFVGTTAYKSDYYGKGVLVTSERDRLFLVTLFYKKKNLQNGLVQDDNTGPFALWVKDGLAEFSLPCNSFNTESDYPPCEFSLTGVSYVEEFAGVLKNATDAFGNHTQSAP